ncbi:MAG: hypothetical protein UW60_C0049G0003 [Candidatus Woesebacteria bacterium GW2011_GWA2_44_33]|uniref:Glycosyltransferase RgtA/B/C/D-like domain-containing protein n=2 Tax=Candidatus Woeseibacteriota TaxID=1752722 RepID=A0A0G1J155_9BACT|nr:MAG: hypothetical protein UW60_C0049G0003 [Candidatus Woesebacteria bacterium GW2011_GWA2_44_33]
MAKVKRFFLVLLLSLVPTLLIWIPFVVKLKSFWGIPLPQDGMAVVVANYDGPLFLVVAKTLYNLEQIALNYSFPLPLEYYAAHFPLFPLLIRLFSFILGYPYSMLFVTLVSSFLALYFFNRLMRRYVKGGGALWLTAVFAVFPARWLIVRSVGAAEPLFVASIIASMYYFQREKYWRAGIWGAVAAATKSPGILLFASYFLYLVVPHIRRLVFSPVATWLKLTKIDRAYPIFLIPLSVLGVFVFYQFTFNDFLAYFHSGDNIHLFLLPFSIFDYSAPWVGTFWLEEIIFIYLLGALGLVKLIRQGRTELAYFVGIFFASILFVSHRDLIRYALPIVPFLFVAFADTLSRKTFKIAFLFIIIPIYLFSLSYISQNVMPISNWGPFL